MGGEDDEAAGRWAERSFEELVRVVDGWVRTRVFKVLDKPVVGAVVEKAKVSPYFVVHGAFDDGVSLFVVLTCPCRIHVRSCVFEPDVQRASGQAVCE